MANSELAIVILAAGCSSRLGQAKQLVHYQGTSLLNRQVDLALSLSSNVIVVLGFQAQQFRAMIDESLVTVVVNNDWQQGMGSSIACGIAKVTDAKAVMLLLVDQWHVNQDDLMGLTKNWQQQRDKIHVSTWHETSNKLEQTEMQQGPPVIFPKAFFTNLIRLERAKGAKSMLVQHKNQVVSQFMPNAKHDLDTQEQLTAMQLLEKR